MQLDLIPRQKATHASGVVHIPDWIGPKEQADLLTMLRFWTHPKGSWYTPTMLDGTPMKHPICSLGLKWVPYRYSAGTLPIPDLLRDLCRSALIDTSLGYPEFDLQTAIINYFPPGSSLGQHQDRSESDAMIRQGSPIITISLGDTGIFRLGNSDNPGGPYQDIELRSGDLIVMSGYSRSCYHGITKIIPDSAPANLQMQPGRISITCRQVFPES